MKLRPLCSARTFSRIHTVAACLSSLLVFVALYLVFVDVPNERIMGPVQRIFYFHVSSAIACYFAIGTLCLGGILMLATGQFAIGPVIIAASEVAFLFASITLATGMTWGDAAWNTIFRFEPRLVSFLLLWLVLLSTQILRVFSDGERLYTLAAVLGIVAACTTPLVVFSITLLPQTVQLHPQVLGNRGLEFPGFKRAFLVSMSALITFQFVLTALRSRLLLVQRRLSFLETKHGSSS